MKTPNITLQIKSRSIRVYAQASEAIARITGQNVSPEAIMAARLESEVDPEDIAAIHSFSVLKIPAEKVREFQVGLTKPRRKKEI